jgi:hypothetical protein
MGRLSPADFHAVYGFRRPGVRFWRAHVRFAVWTIPSPSSESSGGLGAARLVSTPSRLLSPGLARDCHLRGFPEFEQFCIAGFPASTQVVLSPLRMPFRHARRSVSFSVVYDRALGEFTHLTCGMSRKPLVA